jgi:hypothetical protein
MMTPGEIPERLEDLKTEFLTSIICARHAGAVVDSFELLDIKRYGDAMVSTSDRLKIKLHFTPGSPRGLDTVVLIKMKRNSDAVLGMLYANEVDFYNRLRSELDIEAPRSLGGVCDVTSARFYLLLEDLSLRGARFPNATVKVTVDEVRAILEQLGRLHAHFWNSPRLKTSLNWYQSHVAGPLHDFIAVAAPQTVAAELEANAMKRQLVADLGMTADRLWVGMCAVQRHQARLPQTILHGDCHIGNTYLLPQGSAGLLDWQLTVRGAWAHDVNYLIITALSTEERRMHERELLRDYCEALRRCGVSNPPRSEEAWREYRRAVVWSFYLGWLTTPIANYGEAINVANLQRLSAAFADLETARLIAEVS